MFTLYIHFIQKNPKHSCPLYVDRFNENYFPTLLYGERSKRGVKKWQQIVQDTISHWFDGGTTSCFALVFSSTPFVIRRETPYIYY